MSSIFYKRKVAPKSTDKYWKHKKVGGLNTCLECAPGSALPNCVGYVWGRWYEILGKAPKLSRANAEDWWSYKDGYTRGYHPEVGAVICWRKGKEKTSADGCGHVAVVEEVYSNGDCLISQSGYKSVKKFTANFGTKKLTKASGYKYGTGYTFQGFIYLPIMTGVKPAAAASTLKRGAKGEKVKALQKCLNYILGCCIAVDGSFGSETEKAVKTFQSTYDLEVDGSYGPISAAQMKECLLYDNNDI